MITVDKEDIVEYYINQNHSVQQTAEHFNINCKTFFGWLHRLNIHKDKTLSQQNAQKALKDKHIMENNHPTKDELYQYYIVQNHSETECCQYFSVSRSSIQRRIKKYQLNKDTQQIQKCTQHTVLNKYGYNFVLQDPQIQKINKARLQEKYGVQNIAQQYIQHLDIWNDKDKFVKFLKQQNVKMTAVSLGRYFNAHISTCLRKIHSLGLENLIDIKPATSQYEQEIIDLLHNEFNIDNIIQNDRTVLNGKEIDIYLPDYNFGIEFNGEYWHSEIGHPHYAERNGRSTYHQQKSLEAEQKNVFLFHIFEHEWCEPFTTVNPKFTNSRKKIISRLRSILHYNEKTIGARQCVIKELSYDEKTQFLDCNHFQGNDISSNYYLGLFYQNELVSCMTFGKSKYKKYTWELSRFCNKENYQILGGASKLLKYFVDNKMCKNDILVSYSDITKTSGNLYKTLGFTNTQINDPNYWWVNFNTGDVRTRYQEQAAGEVARMHNKGYYRICDCGTKTWILKK